MLIDADADFTIPWVAAVAGIAKELAALPTFRVYGPGGPVGDGTGSLLDHGPITGATNATPIVVASAGHGLVNGLRVTVAGVGGNVAANGEFTVAGAAANTFQLAGSAGGGAYTSGGTWHATGVYGLTFDSALRSALEPGSTYRVTITYVVSAVTYTDSFEFTVG